MGRLFHANRRLGANDYIYPHNPHHPMLMSLIFLLCLAILIIVILNQSRTSERLSEITAALERLRRELDNKEDVQTVQRKSPPKISLDAGTLYGVPSQPEPPAPEPVQQPAPPQPEPHPVKEEQPVLETQESWGTMKTISAEEMKSVYEAAEEKVQQKFEPAEPEISFWEKFMEKNPDIEKFIGENLFNKIGIAILVLGIGFFLKFAIDKNWINEIGRTFIGFLCGGVLIGLAHRMRKSFAAFSSVLVGGGVAILYITVAIAFHQYHLISQTAAFLLSILITAFTVFLAISYNRVELAVVAILGGFGAPFMVSTGKANLPIFFSWLLILNCGMLVLAYFKKWNIVNIICYGITVLLFGGWMMSGALEEEFVDLADVRTALLFATLYYFVFFLMNVINNVRNGMRFGALEIGILLSNTFLYYGAGMVLLHTLGWNGWQGLFTALLAIFNCVFAWFLFRNSRADRTLVYLLIGLVLTFMSLAAPVQLEGNYITLFWAAEAVLIFWLYRKSGIVQMKYASMAVLVLMLISLVMDWGHLYFIAPVKVPVINKAFITGIVAVAAVYLLLRQVRSIAEDGDLFPGVSRKMTARVLQVLFLVLLYCVIILEISEHMGNYHRGLTALVAGCFNYAYLAVLLWIARRRNDKGAGVLVVLGMLAVLAYLAYYNPAVIQVRTAVLKGELPMLAFLAHYIQVGLLCWLLIEMRKALPEFKQDAIETAFNWFLPFMALYLLSAELDHIAVILRAPEVASVTLSMIHRTGYALLWGIFAFVLMFIGIRIKSRDLRIMAIAVFGITLLKLFLFDLRGLGEGGKIAAFISLGILLLLISFMYQRLKKIILTDDQPVQEETKLPD